MTINNLCYFNPIVWGTVSDWAIFVVTAVTGFLIWRTLKSQTAVQNYQLEDLKLERRRFSIEFLPFFSAEVCGFNKEFFITYPDKVDASNCYAYNIGIRFILNRSIANTITVTVIKPNTKSWSDENNGNIYQFEFLNEQDSFDLSFFVQSVLSSYYFNGNSDFGFSHTIKFKIEYQDGIGNAIIQHVEVPVTSFMSKEMQLITPIARKPAIVESIF